MTMTKTKMLTASALGFSLLLGGTAYSVNAASTNSNAKVNFKSDETGTTKPTDPTNPGDEFTPEETPDPTTGSLRIDFASSLDFGEQTISGEAKDYFAKFTKGTNSTGADRFVPNFVQVTDNSGKNAGWTLEVSGSEFKNGDAVLEGAELTLSGTTLASTMDSKFKPETVMDNIVVGNSNQTVVGAKAEQGMGTWTAAFGNESGTSATDTNKNVKLHVPAETKKVEGTYTSTLTWTLTAGPTTPGL
ncbi:WxL domain-containing protein [Listeria valentina]|uniref:WxL domain-containing protein n=1 Tax=Listeria valentina TaxID=2705293 RepID=UPI00142FE4EF|nr:WxL domain-containing protein [Listeria valentina]